MTMATPAIVACTNCGRKNRVAVAARGVPRCAVCPDVAARYGAQSIPLLVLFRDGEEADRLVGAAPEPQLRQWLEPHLPAERAASS